MRYVTKTETGSRFVTSLPPSWRSTVLSCPYRRCELNWRQVTRVFTSLRYIWDWTLLSSPVCKLETGSRQDKTLHTALRDAKQNCKEKTKQFRNFLSPTVLRSYRRHQKTRQSCLVSTQFPIFATAQSQIYWGLLKTWKLEAGSVSAVWTRH